MGKHVKNILNQASSSLVCIMNNLSQNFLFISVHFRSIYDKPRNLFWEGVIASFHISQDRKELIYILGKLA